MNTSFSKIRHIQESNSRLEKRIILKKQDNVTEETITEGVKVKVRYSTEFGSSSSIIDVTEIPKFSKRFNILSVTPVKDSYDDEEDDIDRYDSGPR
jgi:hypothetical protein